MTRFADIRVEWRVEEIERTLQRKAGSHEVSTLNSDVVRLERANEELRAEVIGLRIELQAMREEIIRLQDQFIQLMPELT